MRLLACVCLWAMAINTSFAIDPPAAVLQAEQARIQTIDRAMRTAVCVFAKEGAGGGSGVVISPEGYALTNFHVVQPAGSYMKCSMADDRLYDAVVVGIDPVGDVALIKLLGRKDFPAAPLANSDLVRAGEWCFAVGNPFLLATDFQPTVTFGMVSGVHRYQYPSGTLIEYADCIQTDASINPGNSGGPLFNAKGEVIGINGRISFEKRVRVNVGVGYAISINQIKHFLGCLHSGRIVDHATWGVTVSNSEGHVLIANILETSDAWRRGLRYDDEIVAFGGRKIDTANAFKNVLGIYPKGWRIPVTYRRDGKEHETFVRLTGVHGEEELIALVQKAPKQLPQPGPRDKDPENPGRPEPKPGERPMPRQPLPIPLPKLPGQEAPPIPAEAAKLIKAKPGYANYYFNELHRDRVWSAFTAKGDFSGAGGEWNLEGDIAGGGTISIKLADTASSGVFPQGEVKLDPAQDLDQQLGPAGSGGLLAALHLWRLMLVSGPTKFGGTSYYGTAPYPGVDGEADVLSAIQNVAEANFVFDKVSGQLAILEMFADPELDPCEIRFSDYRDENGRQFPHKLEVRHGDSVFAVIELKNVSLTGAKQEEPK
ncbi:MAG: trypsin-like peptidase domain-containing protein [Pirellulaceae bacterium]|nr:trypsin-like peptidase domain-containing protein [Pirellulaceae bacterium]